MASVSAGRNLDSIRWILWALLSLWPVCLAAEAGLQAGYPKIEAQSRVVGGDPLQIQLSETYADPVIVCSVNYQFNTVPTVIRVGNVTTDSFEVRLQNPSGLTVAPERISCLIVEEGAWTIDGVSIEARKYLSTTTASKSDWSKCDQRTLTLPFTQPVVIGQVMSANDDRWSVFWARGATRTDPPSSASLWTGKSVAEDSDKTRKDEWIGYIVLDAGHGKILDIEFEATIGPNSIQGVGNTPPYTYAYSTSFALAPSVALANMAGLNGNDGGWAQTHGFATLSPQTLALSIDEDQIGDAERSHGNEQVAYVAFSKPFANKILGPCTSASTCDDGLACNGLEYCDKQSQYCIRSTSASAARIACSAVDHEVLATIFYNHWRATYVPGECEIQASPIASYPYPLLELTAVCAGQVVGNGTFVPVDQELVLTAGTEGNLYFSSDVSYLEDYCITGDFYSAYQKNRLECTLIATQHKSAPGREYILEVNGVVPEEPDGPPTDPGPQCPADGPPTCENCCANRPALTNDEFAELMGLIPGTNLCPPEGSPHPCGQAFCQCTDVAQDAADEEFLECFFSATAALLSCWGGEFMDSDPPFLSCVFSWALFLLECEQHLIDHEIIAEWTECIESNVVPCLCTRELLLCDDYFWMHWNVEGLTLGEQIPLTFRCNGLSQVLTDSVVNVTSATSYGCFACRCPEGAVSIIEIGELSGPVGKTCTPSAPGSSGMFPTANGYSGSLTGDFVARVECGCPAGQSGQCENHAIQVNGRAETAVGLEFINPASGVVETFQEHTFSGTEEWIAPQRIPGGYTLVATLSSLNPLADCHFSVNSGTVYVAEGVDSGKVLQVVCDCDQEATFAVGGHIQIAESVASVSLEVNGVARETQTLGFTGPFQFNTEVRQGDTYRVILQEDALDLGCVFSGGNGPYSSSVYQDTMEACDDDLSMQIACELGNAYIRVTGEGGFALLGDYGQLPVRIQVTMSGFEGTLSIFETGRAYLPTTVSPGTAYSTLWEHPRETNGVTNPQSLGPGDGFYGPPGGCTANPGEPCLDAVMCNVSPLSGTVDSPAPDGSIQIATATCVRLREFPPPDEGECNTVCNFGVIGSTFLSVPCGSSPECPASLCTNGVTECFVQRDVYGTFGCELICIDFPQILRGPGYNDIVLGYPGDQGGNIVANTGLTVGASVQDPDGLSSFSVYVDGTRVHQESLSGIAADIQGRFIDTGALSEGPHTVAIEAMDNHPQQRANSFVVYIVNVDHGGGGSCASDCCAPTVAITAPVNGASITAGTVVSVSSTASDDSGVPSVIRLILDPGLPTEQTLKQCNNSGSCSVNWTATAGSRQIRAAVWDQCNKYRSTTISVNVTGGACAGDVAVDSVSLDVSPLVAAISQEVSIMGSASDTNGITNVSLLLDPGTAGEQTLRFCTTPLCATTWIANGVGSHTLRARAVDTCGNVRTANRTIVVEDQCPGVPGPALQSLTIATIDGQNVYSDGDMMEPAIVKVRATVSDVGGVGIDRVLFDPSSPGDPNFEDQDGPPWESMEYWFMDEQEETVTVTVFDNCGRTATEQITVSVNDNAALCSIDVNPPWAGIYAPDPNVPITAGSTVTLMAWAADDGVLWMAAPEINGYFAADMVVISPDPNDYVWVFPNVQAGNYTVRIWVLDVCGKQNYSLPQTFHVVP